jgi:hypothetical protein
MKTPPPNHDDGDVYLNKLRRGYHKIYSPYGPVIKAKAHKDINDNSNK